MNIKALINGFLWIAVMVVLLTSCGSSEESKLTHYINTIKSRPSAPIEPLPEFKPLKTFVYAEEDNRRSPFKPKAVEQKDMFAPNTKRPKQPLEAFPLDALKFVGILKQGSVIWALVKDPSGLITRVRVGDYMGQNYGQIKSINEKTIQLDELMQGSGRWEKKPITINLSVPD